MWVVVDAEEEEGGRVEGGVKRRNRSVFVSDASGKRVVSDETTRKDFGAFAETDGTSSALLPDGAE